MQPQTPKFSAWLAAEKEAQQAERELQARMMQYARSTEPAPMPDSVLMAHAKRAKAHGLFDEAMKELKDIAESLHHRKLDMKRPDPAKTLQAAGDGTSAAPQDIRPRH